VSMAGGYGRDIDDTVAVHLRTLQEACASALAARPAAIQETSPAT